MQVSTVTPPPTLTAGRDTRPAKQEVRPAPVRKSEAAAPKLERALAQAAGLGPDAARQVRVALSVDSITNQVVAKVINKDTGELVRQVPAEQVLRNAALIREMLGATIDKKV